MRQRHWSALQQVTGSQLNVYGDNFKLADTYPLEFVLPAALTESEIQVAAKFRSRKRQFRFQRTVFLGQHLSRKRGFGQFPIRFL